MGQYFGEVYKRLRDALQERKIAIYNKSHVTSNKYQVINKQNILTLKRKFRPHNFCFEGYPTNRPEIELQKLGYTSPEVLNLFK